MREPDRLLQAMIDRETEPGLAFDPLGVVGDDARGLVPLRLGPLIPRDRGATFEVERDQRVRSDDVRAEPDDIEAREGAEPLAIAGAERRHDRAARLEAEVLEFRLEREPAEAIARGRARTEGKHGLRLAI